MLALCSLKLPVAVLRWIVSMVPVRILGRQALSVVARSVPRPIRSPSTTPSGSLLVVNVSPAARKLAAAVRLGIREIVAMEVAVKTGSRPMSLKENSLLYVGRHNAARIGRSKFPLHVTIIAGVIASVLWTTNVVAALIVAITCAHP